MLIHKKILEKELAKYAFQASEEHKRIFAKWRDDKQKETSIQSDFLNDIFGKILGYEKETDKIEYNLNKEEDTETDGTHPDGSLGYFGSENKDVRVVIELKGKNTKNLDKVEKQAFEYRDKIRGVEWVITSNTAEIRLYSASSGGRVNYESFSLVELAKSDEEIKKFHLLLSKDNLFTKEKSKSSTHRLISETDLEEKNIEKKFYAEYSKIRIDVWNDLKKQNPDISEELLLSKTQKLLDRVLFICFAEDSRILPDKILEKAIESEFVSKWEQLKGLFKSVDTGNPPANIPTLNGGLFKKDTELESLNIENDTIKHIISLSKWDFASELSVNILGHVFEQSISDLEEEKAKLKDEEYDKKKGKRKKDGVFYTPEYITRYIVEEAVGGWLDDRKTELEFDKLAEITEEDINLAKIKKKKLKKEEKQAKEKIELHLAKWKEYVKKLKSITVLDPACGSGAFLVQVFDYLEQEWEFVNERLKELTEYLEGEGFIGIFEQVHNYKQILQKNIYGVDINYESVQITRLSLWLKTAHKKEVLTSLDDNIKVGNSLIDDESVAGIYKDDNGEEKSLAFKWEEEFPNVFEKGGFDVVVGNPPYVFARGGNFNKEEKQYYYDNYKLTDYQINTYLLFIEKSYNSIAHNSYLGFIVPNNWLTINSFVNLREFILYKTNKTQILNSFGSVFESASVDSCILLFSKQKNDMRISLGEMVSGNITLNQCNKNEIALGEDKIININQSDKIENIKILHKINDNSRKLEDIAVVLAGICAYEVGKGEPIQTKEMKDSRVYHSYKKENNTYIRYLDGVDVSRFCLYWGSKFISYGKWLAAPRKETKFEGDRILVRQIPSKLPYAINAVFTNEQYINDRNSMTIQDFNDNYNPLFILLIINSKLVSFWFDIIFNKFSRTIFPQFKINELKQFPISIIEDKKTQHPFITLAQKMLDLNKSLGELKTKFHNLIKAETGNPEKLSKKLQKYYELESDDFIKELDKLLKKQKLPAITLAKKSQWLEYFDIEKQKAQKIKQEIDSTDNIIDHKVYALYGLTDEEIKIVEGEV